MSALWLKLITILCLSCAALSDPESSGVVWRDLGEAITIQCRPPEHELNQEFLTLKKGLSEDTVLFKERNSDKNTIATEFTGRLQLNGVVPDMDILIKNLTTNDTGPYWCEYKRFDQKSSKYVIMKGKGSVLLVVTDSTAQWCEPSNKNLVLVPVVISAIVLFAFFVIFLIWIIHKTKTLRTTVKPRRVTTNDVYEDMRGTHRR